MKKLAAIFFLTIYTATAFGVVIKFHYCDRNLTPVIISDLNGNCTCNSKSFIPKDCCTDKTICLQVNSLENNTIAFCPGTKISAG